MRAINNSYKIRKIKGLVKMKNIFWILLFVVASTLSYFQFGIKTVFAEECKQNKSIKKMSPQKVIFFAEIHGISLVTPISEIDRLLNKAGYQCQRSNNSWRCAHTKLSATINITAKDNEVINIMRSGEAYLKDMDHTLDLLDYLKPMLNTREGLSIIQNSQNVGYTFSYKKDNGQLSTARYQMNYMHKPNENGKGGVLSVIIAR